MWGSCGIKNGGRIGILQLEVRAIRGRSNRYGISPYHLPHDPEPPLLTVFSTPPRNTHSDCVLTRMSAPLASMEMKSTSVMVSPEGNAISCIRSDENVSLSTCGGVGTVRGSYRELQGPYKCIRVRMREKVKASNIFIIQTFIVFVGSSRTMSSGFDARYSAGLIHLISKAKRVGFQGAEHTV